MPLTLDLQAYSPAGSILSFSNTGLPTGMSLSSSTGVITGTPTTAGNYLVTITVTVGGHSTTEHSPGKSRLRASLTPAIRPIPKVIPFRCNWRESVQTR